MEKNKVVRILQINAGEKYGGVSAMLYNFYSHINKEIIQFDFLAPTTTSFYLQRKEIEEQGGRIIELRAKGFFLKRKICFWNRLYHWLSTQKYKVIHIHSGSVFFNIQVALIAKLCHVPRIIIHSHSAGSGSKIRLIMGKPFKCLFAALGTDFLSCSEQAAQFMFPSTIINQGKYKIVRNGIDVKKFQFSIDARKNYRQLLGVNGKKVVLHVGRFSSVKNHEFLIDIFYNLQKKENNVCLLLVGEGETQKIIKQKVNDLGIEDKVKFLGLRSDISEIMSASDIFVLPSLYEGLPVVGIEAQANGLKCIFSKGVTEEVNVLGDSIFISLSDEIEEWSNEIWKVLCLESHREDVSKKIVDSGYAIENAVKYLEEIYLS